MGFARGRRAGHGSEETDGVVVGGGIAGLTAASCAARETGAGGRRPRVTLLETVSELGGRARTRDERGFLFNMGPHALYAKAEGMAVLRELGVAVQGSVPPAAGALALRDGRLHALPGGFVSIVSTSLLALAEKLEVARFLAGLGRLDPTPWDGVAVTETLAHLPRRAGSRALAGALVRVTSDANAPDRHSGGVALRQIQRAVVAAKKLMRELPVAHTVPLASQGGETGRPGAALHGRPGLLLAGDWVGPTGQLADAAVVTPSSRAPSSVRRPAAISPGRRRSCASR